MIEASVRILISREKYFCVISNFLSRNMYLGYIKKTLNPLSPSVILSLSFFLPAPWLAH